MSGILQPGSVLIGVAGTRLDARDRDHLLHPAVGGVVLFSRNFINISQLTELTDEIRQIRDPRLLICVDQEGGRVQRFKNGFTRLPPLRVLGTLYSSDRERAMDLAYRHARVMAAEVLACGIDLSFAPVLDIDGASSVIGDRAFSPSVEVVIQLGRAYLAGMHDAGMKTTGKHFPGHGSVRADSHTEDVVDERTLAELEATDLAPFKQLASGLDALMVAHVCYPRVDGLPAGYSRRWLTDYLRGRTRYSGVIMSDDLCMHAARVAGDMCTRIRRCLQGGCDLALVCRPDDVEKLLQHTGFSVKSAAKAISALYGVVRLSPAEMDAAESLGSGEWRQWKDSLNLLSDMNKRQTGD